MALIDIRTMKTNTTVNINSLDVGQFTHKIVVAVGDKWAIAGPEHGLTVINKFHNVNDADDAASDLKMRNKPLAIHGSMWPNYLPRY